MIYTSNKINTSITLFLFSDIKCLPYEGIHFGRTGYFVKKNRGAK